MFRTLGGHRRATVQPIQRHRLFLDVILKMPARPDAKPFAVASAADDAAGHVGNHQSRIANIDSAEAACQLLKKKIVDGTVDFSVLEIRQGGAQFRATSSKQTRRDASGRPGSTAAPSAARDEHRTNWIRATPIGRQRENRSRPCGGGIPDAEKHRLRQRPLRQSPPRRSPSRFVHVRADSRPLRPPSAEIQAAK